MYNKLTLRLDDALITKAKRIAQAKGLSVSAMIASMIEVMPDPTGENDEADWVAALDSWTRSLYGVASDYASMSDAEIEAEYTNYLTDKYR